MENSIDTCMENPEFEQLKADNLSGISVALEVLRHSDSTYYLPVPAETVLKELIGEIYFIFDGGDEPKILKLNKRIGIALTQLEAALEGVKVREELYHTEGTEH